MFAQPLKCYQKLNDNEKPEIPKMITNGVNAPSVNNNQTNPIGVNNKDDTNQVDGDNINQGKN